MAKKKNSNKKHKFKHVEAAATAQVSSTSTMSEAATVSGTNIQQQSKPAGQPAGRDFGYVVKDVRRITILVGALVALELLFYYLLVFTSVGPAVYDMVKV
jgi:hypothetical protein